MSEDARFQAACSLPEPPVPGWWKVMLALLLLGPASLALLRPTEGLMVLLLLPVLLLHEAGHVVALRRFGLGERRILFVPFLDSLVPATHAPSAFGLGAAFLAGSLPGLVLALAAQLAYRTSTDGPAGAFIAWLVLFNGANLLPVGAFDAGRLLDMLLLRRRPWLAAWLWLAPVAVLAGLGWQLNSWAFAAAGGVALLGTMLHYPRLCQGRALGAAPTDRQLFEVADEGTTEGTAAEMRWLRANLAGPEPTRRGWMGLLALHTAGLLLASATLLLLADDARAERERAVERLARRLEVAGWKELVEEWKQAPPSRREQALQRLQWRSLKDVRLRQRVARIQRELSGP